MEEREEDDEQEEDDEDDDVAEDDDEATADDEQKRPLTPAESGLIYPHLHHTACSTTGWSNRKINTWYRLTRIDRRLSSQI